ncbi:hypothetical protein PHPALM_31777 [Phytophthora palmivora]|uniref:PiggyBac transposable element-derived protein domain-containing protein n=1 Tax=Phytophthora palmivora TaxID=4796 RepID=A0A2P4X1R2_9STRA|nr:hypothetical protein PHPALM_31777 [Phytophthora palmivora]
MYTKQRTPGKVSREEYMNREGKIFAIEPHEILHVLGLLMARMLSPQRRRFRDHWQTEGIGAVPRGTFNDFMPRHRFEHIMANLHFTNNADAQAALDRAWKVRSVIETLQETFPRGYKTPPVISFDEGIIPSRNRNNPTRQYLNQALYLCNKAWKHFPGNSMTCFQIWHNRWENGTKRPHPRCGRDIQTRAAGTGGGKKRKHRGPDEEEGDAEVDAEYEEVDEQEEDDQDEEDGLEGQLGDQDQVSDAE